MMTKTKYPTGRVLQVVVCLLLAVTVLVGVAPPAVGAERVDPYTGMDRDQRRVFQAYTRLFCRQFFRYGEDRFVVLPNHYRDRENSNGRTYDQALHEMTEVRIIRRGNTKHEERIEPHPGEVIASALVLPAMDVGHYGMLSEVTIDEVLGPEEMIVSEVTLIPQADVGTEANALRKQLWEQQKQYEDKTYRLLGFSTRGLTTGERYLGPDQKGLHIAVMSTDPRHHFVLVNYDKLERIRTTEFHEALAYVHLTPLAFIDMVRDNRERLRTDGDKASLIAIYRRYYSRYRPARVAPAPAVRPQPPADQPAGPATPGPDQPDGPQQPDPPAPDRPGTAPDQKPADPEFIDAPPPEDDEDDWEYDEGQDTSPDEPGFFGIPF